MGEFTQSRIRSTERQLQDVNKKISVCLGKEKEINTYLSQLRKSGKPAAQTQQGISDLEERLSRILQEHERYERERGRLSRELERLQQNAGFEESLHREEEKRKQAQKKQKEEFFRITTFSAGTVAGATSQAKRNQPQKRQKPSGSGCLGTVGKWFILFVVIGVLINAITSRDSSQLKETNARKPAEETETIQQGPELSQWIGMTAEDIFALYGEDFCIDGMNGGIYFYYEDACPYEFYYYGGENMEPKLSDQIYGVATWGEGICVVDGIQIGENIQQIKEKLGSSLALEASEESEFYPFLEETIQKDGFSYHLLFGPESKNLVRATAMKKE